MKDTIVRLSGIWIENFKNVKKGELHFTNHRKNYKASVLGLYGQNGSGKTALIDVLKLLSYILSGKTVSADMVDCINIDADCAKLSYQFDVTVPTGSFKAFYSFQMKQEAYTDDLELINVDEEQELLHRLVIYNEILSYSYNGENKKIRKSPLIDASKDPVFFPASKYECLIGKDQEQELNLTVAKKMAANMSRSFIFSRELLNAARKNHNDGEEYLRHMKLLESLHIYGNYELFVFDITDTGMINMNALPLMFKYNGGNKSAIGKILIPLNKPVDIPKDTVLVVQGVLQNMNVVLKQLIPGLTIGLRELGYHIMKNGKEGVRIQLISMKNGKELPLKYESEGIKKIISILQLLIVVYNQESITVAIDELDGGIFEYLLGEITRIVSERGKGQLIFTSHNLRPLETIDRGFIAFTSTNPEKRYVRMTNIKDSNNLRDYYFRDIILGGQDEELYEQTNNAEIALAFREAGEFSGT